MQPTLPNDPNEFTHELALLKAIIQQDHTEDGRAIVLDVISQIRNYLNAGAIVFLSSDSDISTHVQKKILTDGTDWHYEDSIFVENNYYDALTNPQITPIERTLAANARLNDLVCEHLPINVENAFSATLNVHQENLGTLIIINSALDLNNTVQCDFLQIVLHGLANALHNRERTRELAINNAEMEALQWQVINSRNTLRTFFDNIPSQVYIIDQAYSIMAINDQRSEKAQKNHHELVGKTCYVELAGRTTPCLGCRVTDTFRGIPTVRESRELTEDESFIHWEVSTFPIRDKNEKVSQVIIVEEDVTEKWILEENLIQSEKFASMGRLAANIAHEINNPLAAIIANAQLLLLDMENAEADVVESLELIESAGQRASKIVSGLLENARRENREEFEGFCLNASIQDALSMVSFEIKKLSVSVELDLAENMPPIHAHKDRIKGIWINLIMNALSAMEEETGVIAIATRHSQDTYHITIADNGKGIPETHQEHIFEPFFTTKDAGKGTGLGLFVSHQVIQDHHGDIWFESTPDTGTAFYITLPDVSALEE